MVADRIVQLDYQTRGRAMFGFGPGLLPSEDAMMLGIDPETQRDRMADAIDIITRLLAGEVITQEGEWYTMREARSSQTLCWREMDSNLWYRNTRARDFRSIPGIAGRGK
jgi:alkanesulfonate monooxygenase SsuD/methylene tetrahydromethanopterin reductase-like flavin-dependent oxidoreductase (luciferase family)